MHGYGGMAPVIFWLVMLGMAWLNVWGRDQAER